MGKFLDYAGLQKFYGLIINKFLSKTEDIDSTKGIMYSNIDPENALSPKKLQIKLGSGMSFDESGNITAHGLAEATNSKLGTIKTYVDTYDVTLNPNGTGIGTEMIASDPTKPTVKDRINLVGVQGIKEKGQKNGYASLDSDGHVPAEQLPSYVDDVIEGYYNAENGKFYKEISHGEPTPELPDGPVIYSNEDIIDGETGKIYVDLATSNTYRWSGSTYVEITSGSFGVISDREIEELFV